MEHQDEYVPLSILLADHWDKPLSELPKALQAKGGFFTMLWDRLNREQRHELVSQIDYQEDPKNAGERHVGWYDMSMDARVWGYLQDVSPKEAAMVLCRLNPFDREDPESIYVDGDETSPHKYKLLLRTFEGVASTTPKHRTLMEWRTIAQQHNLRYHSWIDDYADAMGAPAGKQAATDAMKNTTSKANEQPPGKTPRTAIGKLAIKAAWQIECETKRPAIVNVVINRLQEWVAHEDELLEKIKGGVRWQTKGCKANNFDIEACAKALERWHKSRH